MGICLQGDVQQAAPSEKASGAEADRAELRKVVSRLGDGDVLMVTAMDLKKEKNFFETRVIACQNRGALNWD